MIETFPEFLLGIFNKSEEIKISCKKNNLFVDQWTWFGMYIKAFSEKFLKAVSIISNLI